jgi:hypothetical protein
MRQLHASMLLIPCVLGACASSSGLVGSWRGEGTTSERPFTFGAVSFVDDGTFTAEARYGRVVRVQSGHWTLDGNNLELVEDERAYTIHIMGDTVRFTDPESGNSMLLTLVS